MKQLKTLAVVALVVVAGLAVGRGMELSAQVNNQKFNPLCWFGFCKAESDQGPSGNALMRTGGDDPNPNPNPPSTSSSSSVSPEQKCLNDRKGCFKRCDDINAECKKNKDPNVDCYMKWSSCVEQCNEAYDKCKDGIKKRK